MVDPQRQLEGNSWLWVAPGDRAVDLAGVKLHGGRWWTQVSRFLTHPISHISVDPTIV